PLEGVVMGTLSGNVDPGMLIYLLRHKGLSAEQLDCALNHESGLLGISGTSSDMRQILEQSSERMRRECGSSRARIWGIWGWNWTAPSMPSANRMRMSPWPRPSRAHTCDRYEGGFNDRA